MGADGRFDGCMVGSNSLLVAVDEVGVELSITSFCCSGVCCPAWKGIFQPNIFGNAQNSCFNCFINDTLSISAIFSTTILKKSC